ncbi:hypothetical protein PXH69_24395 [Rhodococcus qingshengii]|uniref:Uncharacterized protein n=1 Tax=Rhodococcus qingshengii TaxID=334542 RepID=A0AAW6LS80_RHOSG|nr:hypothetical protein [Rhodococcus qingshengii]MDE8648111.1 hypothetical protein [Rhodococcus qingshengii]
MATNPQPQTHNFASGAIGFVSRVNSGVFPIIRVKVRKSDPEVTRPMLTKAAEKMLSGAERVVPMYDREEDGFLVYYYTASEVPRDARQASRMAKRTTRKKQAEVEESELVSTS